MYSVSCTLSIVTGSLTQPDLNLKFEKERKKLRSGLTEGQSRYKRYQLAILDKVVMETMNIIVKS